MTFRGDLASADHLTPFSEWDGVVFVDEAFKIRYVSGIANNCTAALVILTAWMVHWRLANQRDVVLIDEAFRHIEMPEHQVIEGGP